MGWWGGGGKYQQKKDVEIIYNSSNSHCFMSVCFFLSSGCFWQRIKHQFFVTVNVVFHFFLSNMYTLYIEYCLVTLNSSARKAVFNHTNWMGELDGFTWLRRGSDANQSIYLDDFR